MSTDTDRSTRLTVEELAARSRAEMIPLNNTFSYFATLSIAEEDLRQYLHDPIAALPSAICTAAGSVGILLVPHLERGNGRSAGWVDSEKPPEGKQVFWVTTEVERHPVLLFATKEVDVADYHYHFYNAIATVISNHWAPESQDRYLRLLREEFGADVHGEVDEKSWHLKQALVRRQSNARKETKAFREYARQSFADTLTLYLHGICCDIDVETGPRQMPSRYLRRRLELLEGLYPPPEGYAVFPEQIRKAR
jgi:hypothetical protein